MRVSVIVLNWNGKELLDACLASLEAQTVDHFETVVVDNGSTDGSLSLPRLRSPRVRLVSLPENAGFAAGNNAGYAVSSGDFLATLNNDAVAEPRWLEELLRTAEDHPGAGMIASRICSLADPEVIDSVGMRVCRDGMSRGAFRNRRFSSLDLRQGEPVLCPSACAALYRRKMVEETGFFDEDFFAYCEDTDLGLRGRRAGWGSVLARDAVVGHRYSATAGRLSPFKLYLVERNHFWVALKTFPASMLPFLPLWTARRYLRQASLVMRRTGTGGEFAASADRNECALALARGLLDAWRGAPAILRKRRRALRHGAVSDADFRSLLRGFEIPFSELLDS